jgi:uncharacterized repeat protein (TIGR01451 family)
VQHKRSSLSLFLLGTTLVSLFIAASSGQLAAQAAGEFVPVKPGDVITNTVTFLNNGIKGSASASFTVTPAPLTGEMRAYVYAGPGSAYENKASHSYRFPVTLFSKSGAEGPFYKMTQPVDNSTLAKKPSVKLPMSGLVAMASVDVMRKGMPVFFVLTDDSLNLDDAKIDTVVVMVRDQATGDVEYLVLSETLDAQGVFTGWVNTQPVAVDDLSGVLSTGGQSQIVVSYLDAYGRSNELSDEVLVGPFAPNGVVFDSLTGAPIDGAVITLIDMATGEPAEVRGENLSASYPSRVQSGAATADASGRSYDADTGAYRFPSVGPGQYRLSVTPPDGYLAPSKRTDDEIGANAGVTRQMIEGSRLEPFDVGIDVPIRIDIPLDRIAKGAIEREGTLSRAEPGDFIGYTVTITPPATAQIDIADALPASVRFVPGSLRINGRALSPQVSTDGLSLRIENWTVGADREIVITYLAQVVPGVTQTAAQSSLTTVTEADTGRMSMSDDHLFRLTSAFGMDEVVILGQVMAGPCGAPDFSRDLSGIRVLLETGEFAVTDERGRFTFREISERPHVLQVDEVTLPRHAKAVLCHADTRSAGSAISRFVDVQPGMMARSEFHIEFDETAAATEDALREAMEPDAPAPDAALAFDQDWLDRTAPEEAFRILSPAIGSVPSSEAISVAFLRPRGTISILTVNGELITRDRLNMPITNETTGATVDRYDGIRIVEGRNDISVRIMKDGEQIATDTRQIYFATKPAFAKIISEASSYESDGRSLPFVQIQLLGRDGYPVRAGTSVQINIDAPHSFAAPVVRKSAPQASRGPSNTVSAVVGYDGMIRVALAPVTVTGRAKITIARDESDTPITLEPMLSAAARPWVVVGIAEGTVAETGIRRHMRPSGDIGNAFAGRISLFAEGVIKGKYLMTLRYDSEGGAPQDGFEGLDPEKDYIVYGDRSYQEDGAPSRFPLYLRLKSEEAEVLIGDFDLDLSTQLISVNRRLTGLRTTFENDRFRVMAFAAETSQRYVEDRIAIDGTAGPFALSRSDIVAHSETVTLLEVDADDLSRVISETTLQSGVDYAISSEGGIFLRRAVPAFSPDMNRFILVIGYEADEEITDGMIAGVRATAELTERARLGGTVLQAGNVEGSGVDVTLTGVDLSYAVNDALILTAEIVQADRRGPDGSEVARAGELRAAFDDGTSEADIYLRAERGDVSITPLDHRISRDIIGARANVLLYDTSKTPDDLNGLWFNGTAIAENDLTTDTLVSRGAAELLARDGLREYGTGLRYTLTDSRAGTENDADAAVLYATSRVAWTTADEILTFGIGMDYPLIADQADADAQLRLSVAYAVTDDLAISASFEGAGPNSDPVSGGTTLLSFNLSHQFADEAGIASFGVLRAADQDQSGAALTFGAQRSFEVNENVSLSFGIDAQKDLGAESVPLGADIDTPYVAGDFATLRFAASYTQEAWGAGLSAERRLDDEGGALSFRLTADGELTDLWSIGGEAIFAKTSSQLEPVEETVLRFSAAHRGDDRDPITLLQFEMKSRREDDELTEKLMLSAARSTYIGDNGHLNLRYAAKNVKISFNGIDASDVLQLAGAEYRHDMTEAFDIGLHGAVLHSLSTGTAEKSIGASVGFTPFDNGYISVGYNAVGFSDDDFSQNGYTDKGAFVQFRVKFDKDTFRNAFK